MPADAACAAYAALLDEVAPAWDAAAAGAASGTKSSKAMGPVFSSLGAAPDDGDDNGAQVRRHAREPPPPCRWARGWVQRLCASAAAQGGEGGGELAAAAREGGLERVRALLAAGADCGARDADGCTPLHWAADRGHCEVTGAPGRGEAAPVPARQGPRQPVPHGRPGSAAGDTRAGGVGGPAGRPRRGRADAAALCRAGRPAAGAARAAFPASVGQLVCHARERTSRPCPCLPCL